MAAMLRGDLAAARKAWLDEVKHDPDARAKREESDFLAVTNHQGEELDFHALRHTTGSWLALQGIHPNIIKTVMRHSTITLTMDTYGHLLPDQHADAIGGMVNMLAGIAPAAATGTAGKPPPVQRTVGTPNDAMECESVRAVDESADMRQTLEFPRRSEDDEAENRNTPGRIRTCDRRIRNPLLYPAELRGQSAVFPSLFSVLLPFSKNRNSVLYYLYYCRFNGHGSKVTPAVVTRRRRCLFGTGWPFRKSLDSSMSPNSPEFRCGAIGSLAALGLLKYSSRDSAMSSLRRYLLENRNLAMRRPIVPTSLPRLPGYASVSSSTLRSSYIRFHRTSPSPRRRIGPSQ